MAVVKILIKDEIIKIGNEEVQKKLSHATFTKNVSPPTFLSSLHGGSKVDLVDKDC